MKGIGGNAKAFIQNCTTVRNSIGENVPEWVDVQSVTGWLDLQNGTSNTTNFNSKIQESTHIFVADYVLLNSAISSENSRMVINGKRYEILLIDDPMEMHLQIEFYLKFTGGQ